ncbi:hypothetical protein [Anatilimnocola floriformis]|uniref:hypothetical protein n=1 Tax=Anatilimnocola floriformis TaxID=2948575 RepID=UPI0020C4953A|nr:hypothetical protein [Anatilimnocola floriformis]
MRTILCGCLLICCAAFNGVQGQEVGNAQLSEEVTAARNSLKDHPKFKKFYDHLAANPDTLPVNGPKLAVLLAAEAKTSAAIKDHAPSLLATWQEVVRLAAAGNDYKTAIPSIDLLQKHPSGLLSPAAARKVKGKVLAAVAEANSTRLMLAEREALAESVRGLLKESLEASDAEALPSLLAADSKLSWSTSESAKSVQLLLPLAEHAASSNQANIAKLLFDHLEVLIPKTAAGKIRKEFADTLAAARERLQIVEVAQQAQQALATKPLDPAANQAYGMYLLASGQARESLTYLALGSDPSRKQLATATLEAKTATDKISLADRWQATAEAAAKGMARLLYEEALADKAFVGIPRAAAEEKLKALGPAPAVIKPARHPSASPANKPLPVNEWVDVLPLVDIDHDLGRGFWTKGPQNSLLHSRTYGPRLRLPVLLANSSYDLVVEFKLAEAYSDIYLILPVGDRMVRVMVDADSNNDHCYFLTIPQGPLVTRNLLRANQAHRYEANVRLREDTAQIVFSVDGAKILEYDGPLSRIESKTPEGTFFKTFAQPGLGAYNQQVLYTKVQVRAIDGQAFFGRDVPLVNPLPPDIAALKATRLTTLRPLAGTAYKDFLSVSAIPAAIKDAHVPWVGGQECRDYLFAHAPSSVSYSIPPKTRYFTAVACNAIRPEAKFVVKVDGQELFAAEGKPIATVLVEIPEGAKVLQLECEGLVDRGLHYCSWCFPAFRQ